MVVERRYLLTAVGLHLLVLGLLFVDTLFTRKVVAPPVIEAALVSETYQQRQEEIERQRQEQERQRQREEQQRLEQERRQQREEQQKQLIQRWLKLRASVLS